MERKFVGKLVVLDRGQAVLGGGQDDVLGHAVLVGGVLIAHEPIVQDPSKAEMWEVEVTIRPLAVHRGHVYGNGSSMDDLLVGGYHDPDMWMEHDLPSE